ncbi:MAG: hypothetical protein H6R38_476 [Deltaproteobacteria bacterium]|nr:hypothetical protein [Deltaproteobacteria bacterium]
MFSKMTTASSTTSPISQNEIYDQHDQPDGFEQGHVHPVDGAFDEHGGVVALQDPHAFRKIFIDRGGLRLGQLGDRQGIGLRLLDDSDAHHRDSVAAQHVAALGRAGLNTGHIPQPDQVAVSAARENEVLEIRDGSIAPLDAHAEIPCSGFHVTGGQLDVFGPQGVFDIRYGQVAGGQLIAVDPDPHGVLQPAADLDPGHAVQS